LRKAQVSLAFVDVGNSDETVYLLDQHFHVQEFFCKDEISLKNFGCENVRKMLILSKIFGDRKF